jgi:hypothetical protein
MVWPDLARIFWDFSGGGRVFEGDKSKTILAGRWGYAAFTVEQNITRHVKRERAQP